MIAAVSALRHSYHKSVAVLVDATIVRLVLVPAAMELLGNANWWMPSWLGRVLPRASEPGRAPART